MKDVALRAHRSRLSRNVGAPFVTGSGPASRRTTLVVLLASVAVLGWLAAERPGAGQPPPPDQQRAGDGQPAGDEQPAGDGQRAGEGQREKLPQAGAGRFRKAVLIRFEGDIHPLSEHYLYRKLDEARRIGADLVIVEIDSPGGHVQSSLDLAEKLRYLDWAHTVAYIPSEAYSGASIVALGCDEIVIGPDAQFGDAGPIFRGQDSQFHHAPEKIRSVLVSQVRDLAESRGRSPALAQAMVDMDVTVYRMTHNATGEVRFLSQQEIDSADDADQWTRGPPVLETQGKLFLTVNGKRAVELGLAEANLAGRDQLRSHFGLNEDPVVLQHGVIDTAVWLLNRPLVTGLLLVIGLVALYFELSAPGISVGGLTSGLCFALFFWSRFLGGTSTWLEIVLFVAGLIFLGVELFVLPGFGVAGVAGILLMLISLVMASQDFVIPSTPRQMTTLATSLMVLVGSGVVFLMAAWMISRHHRSIPVFNRLVLSAPVETTLVSADGKPLAQSAAGGSRYAVQVGDMGVSASPLRPAGKARFGDDYVDVVADGLFVETARPIRVIKTSGNRIVVREVEPPYEAKLVDEGRGEG